MVEATPTSSSPRRQPCADPDCGAAAELTELRRQVREAQDTLEAIRSGGIDSLVIGPPDDAQIYTLSTADQPYRLIVAGMGEGAATVSASGTVLYANARLAAMTTRAVSQLTGAPVLDLAEANDRDTLRVLLDVPAGGTARGQVNLRSADGCAVPVLVAVSGLTLSTTSFVRCLIATDLTAQREAERELARSNAALRKREVFLEQAAQLVGLGTWESGPTLGGGLTWSANVYDIAGYSTDTFDQQARTYLVDLVHPDDRAAVTAAFNRAVAGHAPFRIRHRIVRPDGTLRWVAQAAVVDYDNGIPTRLLGVVQDITEQAAAGDGPASGR